LALATTWANKGFMIANSVEQDHHPKKGDVGFPEGCPCGFCRLIRDAKGQARGVKVESDLLNTIWMQHLSFPEYITSPAGEEPDGVDYPSDGFDLMNGTEMGSYGTYLLTGRDDSDLDEE